MIGEKLIHLITVYFQLYQNNHKNFILLALPMAEKSVVDFKISSGDPVIWSDWPSYLFWNVFVILLVIFLAAISWIALYFFVRNRNHGYIPQVDVPTFRDDVVDQKNSARVLTNIIKYAINFSNLLTNFNYVYWLWYCTRNSLSNLNLKLFVI